MEPLWIESDEFSARWANVPSALIDKITGILESELGPPDTIASKVETPQGVDQAIISRRTAFRTVNGVRIVATYNGGPYIDLHWHTADGPAFEVINVYDYRVGARKPFNLSQELSDWIRENRREIANYWRHTA